jgi:hypothetical protein
MNGHLGTRARSVRRFVAALVLVLLAVAITGCNSFFLGPLLDGETAEPLSIDPASTVIATDARATFIASGGYPPYEFAVDSGDGSIDSSSGVYTATSTDGAATVIVTDLVGNSQTATITVITPDANDVNYAVNSLSWTSGTLAGQTVTGSFVVTNTGVDDGTHEIG